MRLSLNRRMVQHGRWSLSREAFNLVRSEEYLVTLSYSSIVWRGVAAVSILWQWSLGTLLLAPGHSTGLQASEEYPSVAEGVTRLV